MNELPQDWTIEDVQFLLDKLESGCAILVADRNLGIGTIHDFPDAEHAGWGCFRVYGDGYTLTFDAGAAMFRTPSGQSWSPLTIGGSYSYDFDGAKATLRAYLNDSTGFEPGKGDAYDYIPAWMTIPPLYANEGANDPLALIKLFTPDSSWTWYVLEYDGEDIAFGLVVGFETELGYISISELASVTGPMDLRIERDVWFKPTPVTQLAEYQQRWLNGGPYEGQSDREAQAPTFTKQLTGERAEALLAEVAAIVPEMSGVGPVDAAGIGTQPTVVPEAEWQPTPEDQAEFACWELHLLTGQVNSGRKGAFQRALSQIARPGALRLALARVNGDPRRREAIEGRLATLM